MTDFVSRLDFSPRTALVLGAIYFAVAAPVLTSGGMGAGTVAASLVLGTGLVLLSAIDISTYRLPNILTLPLILAGLLFAAVLNFEPSVGVRAIAALGAYGGLWLVAWSYEKLRGRAGMGLGDAKLFAAAAAWLGPEGLPSTLLYACGAALALTGARMLFGKRAKMQDVIAFGPFLAGAFWVVWLYGPLV